MSTVNSDEFDAEFHAFLDDDEAGIPAPPDGALAPAAGFYAMKRALLEAESHVDCDPEGERPYGMVVRVIGTDGIDTAQVIPVGVNVGCVIGALGLDEEVAGIQPLGWETPIVLDEGTPYTAPPPEPVDEPTVRTDLEPPPFPRALPSPQHLRRRRWFRRAA